MFIIGLLQRKWFLKRLQFELGILVSCNVGKWVFMICDFLWLWSPCECSMCWYLICGGLYCLSNPILGPLIVWWLFGMIGLDVVVFVILFVQVFTSWVVYFVYVILLILCKPYSSFVMDFNVFLVSLKPWLNPCPNLSMFDCFFLPFSESCMLETNALKQTAKAPLQAKKVPF